MKRFWNYVWWSWIVLNIAFFGYCFYTKNVYKPPAEIPCTQGMTLMPGQTCHVTIEVPIIDEPVKEKNP